MSRVVWFLGDPAWEYDYIIIVLVYWCESMIDEVKVEAVRPTSEALLMWTILKLRTGAQGSIRG